MAIQMKPGRKNITGGVKRNPTASSSGGRKASGFSIAGGGKPSTGK